MTKISNTANTSVEKWQRWDAQAVVKDGSVDHAASAKKNLAAAWKGLKDGFSARETRSLMRPQSRGNFDFRPLLLPYAVLADFVHVFTKPTKALGDVGQAAAHATLLGIGFGSRKAD